MREQNPEATSKNPNVMEMESALATIESSKKTISFEGLSLDFDSEVLALDEAQSTQTPKKLVLKSTFEGSTSEVSITKLEGPAINTRAMESEDWKIITKEPEVEGETRYQLKGKDFFIQRDIVDGESGFYVVDVKLKVRQNDSKEETERLGNEVRSLTEVAQQVILAAREQRTSDVNKLEEEAPTVVDPSQEVTAVETDNALKRTKLETVLEKAYRKLDSEATDSTTVDPSQQAPAVETDNALKRTKLETVLEKAYRKLDSEATDSTAETPSPQPSAVDSTNASNEVKLDEQLTNSNTETPSQEIPKEGTIPDLNGGAAASVETPADGEQTQPDYVPIELVKVFSKLLQTTKTFVSNVKAVNNNSPIFNNKPVNTFNPSFSPTVNVNTSAVNLDPLAEAILVSSENNARLAEAVSNGLQVLANAIKDLKEQPTQQSPETQEANNTVAKNAAKVGEATNDIIIQIGQVVINESGIVNTGDGGRGGIHIGDTPKAFSDTNVSSTSAEGTDSTPTTMNTEQTSGVPVTTSSTQVTTETGAQTDINILREKVTSLEATIRELRESINTQGVSATVAKPATEVAKRAQELADSVDEIAADTEQETTPEEAGSNVVPGGLSAEEKVELQKAGENDEGFLYSIKRMFTGNKWARGILTMATAVAGATGMKVLAGMALAGGPLGIGILGGALVGLGLFTGSKAIKEFKETSEKQGKTWKDLIKEPNVVWGIAAGALVSGVSKSVMTLVPGWGVLIGLGIEGGTTSMIEKHMNKKQEELLNKYMDTYELRRYKALRDKGYVVRGTDGTQAVGLETILKDIKDLEAGEEKKTAIKAAVAALQALHAKTGNEDHKFIMIKKKGEDGKETLVKLDITKLKLEEQDDSNKDYTLFKLGNIEQFIDNIDLDHLEQTTVKAWNETKVEDKAGLAKEIVERFVGLEAYDVETMLTEERKEYLKAIHFTTGMHAGMRAVNAAMAIGGGTTMVLGGFTGAFGSPGSSPSSSVDTDSGQATQEFRTTHNDPNAEVVRGTNHNGETIDVVRLDGGMENTPDFFHNQTTGEYMIISPEGAEHVFELQNPSVGDVTLNSIQNSESEILGTFTDTSGKVVGITYTDSEGTLLNNMKVEDFSNALSATDSSGIAHKITISSLESNGNAVFEIDGVKHNVNLGKLDDIVLSTGTDGSEVLKGQIGSLIAEAGDSMPKMLQDILTEAKTLNPDLQKYDNYELERMLYKGDRLGNDGILRQEFGIGVPLRVGDEINWSESKTVMSWLQDLNGGKPINLGTTIITTPGSTGNSLSLDFKGLDINSMGFNLDGSSTSTIQGGGQSLLNSGLVTLGIVGSALLAAFGKSQVGGITKKNDPLAGAKIATTGDDTSDSSQTTTTTSTTENREKEIKVDVRKTIIVNQIFNNLFQVKTGNNTNSKVVIQINSKKYQRDSTDKNVWTIVGDENNAKYSSDQVAEQLLSEENKNRDKELAVLLNRVRGETELSFKVEEEDRKYIFRHTKKNGGNPAKFEWFVSEVDSEKIEANELAVIILGLKPETKKIKVTSTEANSEQENSLETLRTNLNEFLDKISKKGNSVVVNGITYNFTASGKSVNAWVIDEKDTSKNLGKDKKEINPNALMNSQIVDSWIKSTTFETDLTRTLMQIKDGTEINNNREEFRKVSIEKDQEVVNFGGVIYQRNVNSKGDYILQQNPNPGLLERIKKKLGANIPAERISGDAMKSYIDSGSASKQEVRKSNLGGMWASENSIYTSADLAKKFAEQRGELSAESKGSSENKDGKVEGEAKDGIEAEKEKKKESKWRKLAKAALVVAGVVGGIAGGVAVFTTFGPTVAVFTGMGSVLTYFGLGIGRDEIDKIGVKQTEELTSKAKKENRNLSDEEQEKIMKEVERRKWYQDNIKPTLKLLQTISLAFGITNLGLGFLNPQITGYEFKAIIDAAWDKVQWFRITQPSVPIEIIDATSPVPPTP